MPYIINNEIGAGKVTTIELWPYNSLKPKGFVFFLGATFALVALPLFNVLGTNVFWGLFPHSMHCKLASNLGVKKCAPHWMHVYVFGLLSFVLALYFKQGTAGLL